VTFPNYDNIHVSQRMPVYFDVWLRSSRFETVSYAFFKFHYHNIKWVRFLLNLMLYFLFAIHLVLKHSNIHTSLHLIYCYNTNTPYCWPVVQVTAEIHRPPPLPNTGRTLQLYPECRLSVHLFNMQFVKL